MPCSVKEAVCSPVFMQTLFQKRVTSVMEQTRGDTVRMYLHFEQHYGVWTFLSVKAVKRRIRLRLGATTWLSSLDESRDLHPVGETQFG